jgi:hypothetical protein
MTVLLDVLKELFSMFLADARLSCAILALVVLVWVAIDFLSIPAIAGGAGLFLGALAILIWITTSEARRKARSAS